MKELCSIVITSFIRLVALARRQQMNHSFSSQAATCVPHTVEAFIFPYNAKRQAEKL